MQPSRIDALIGTLAQLDVGDDLQAHLDRMFIAERSHLLSMGFSPKDSHILASALVAHAVEKFRDIDATGRLRAKAPAIVLAGYLN